MPSRRTWSRAAVIARRRVDGSLPVRPIPDASIPGQGTCAQRTPAAMARTVSTETESWGVVRSAEMEVAVSPYHRRDLIRRAMGSVMLVGLVIGLDNSPESTAVAATLP